MIPSLQEIIDNFELLDDWEDRYRYVIELGRTLPPLPEALRTEGNKVKGCASQVWLALEPDASDPSDPRLRYQADSDAHIVKGLIALLLSIYSGRRASEIASLDALELFQKLGFSEHLTPQRSNGVRAMVDRIRSDARLLQTP